MSQFTIVKEWFEDASEQDENGLYDYYYAGFNYKFNFQDDEYLFRQYHGDLNNAYFTDSRLPHFPLLGRSPYDDFSFLLAAKYLFEEAGVKTISMLDPVVGGYKPVITLEKVIDAINFNEVNSTNENILQVDEPLKAGERVAHADPALIYYQWHGTVVSMSWTSRNAYYVRWDELKDKPFGIQEYALSDLRRLDVG